mgnify:CR=1 FL=1
MQKLTNFIWFEGLASSCDTNLIHEYHKIHLCREKPLLLFHKMRPDWLVYALSFSFPLSRWIFNVYFWDTLDCTETYCSLLYNLLVLIRKLTVLTQFVGIEMIWFAGNWLLLIFENQEVDLLKLMKCVCVELTNYSQKKKLMTMGKREEYSGW